MQHDTLRLYHADRPLRRWVEHPCSPIVEAPHIARPAGRVVSWGGELYRFAQDCSPQYGLSVQTFCICELNAKRYREVAIEANRSLAASASGWNSAGMYHVDAQPLDDGEWLASVDGCVSVTTEEYTRPVHSQ